MIKILFVARMICATLGLQPDDVLTCWFSPASWAGHGERYQQACRIDIGDQDQYHPVLILGYRFDETFEVTTFVESPLED